MLQSLSSRFSSLRAFRHRSFGIMWVGAFLSNVGTWMETIAIGVFVTETTGRAGWTGTIAALMYLPAVVLGPIGGALADRMDRRKYVFVGTIAQTIFAGSLTALAMTGRLTVGAIGLIAMLAGCVSAMLSPAFTALLTEIVEHEDLHSALSLNSAQYNLGRVLGPVLAAAVIERFSISAAFGINTLSFVAVLIAVSQITPIASRRFKGAAEPLWEGIKRGLVATRSDPGIWLAASGTTVAAILISPFIGLVPVMAIKVLGGGPAETSMLVACQGLGAVSAALVAGTLADWIGRRRMLEYASIGIGVFSAMYWLSPRFVFAGASLFLLGGAYLLTMTGLNTVMQTRAPHGLQARISSVFTVVLGGGYALGVLAQGWLGDFIGTRLIAVIMVLLYLGLRFWARSALPEHFAALEGTGAQLATEAARAMPTLDGPADIPPEL